MLNRLVIVVVAGVLAGCHTMHFEVSKQSHAQVVHRRKHFFLWGLAPIVDVDVRQHCPHGVAAVREQTTFVDGLFQIPTLGIWSPRSSWYYCLAKPEKGVEE